MVQHTEVAGDVAKVAQRAAHAISLQEIEISEEGVRNIKRHLATMDADLANAVMLKRLEDIASGMRTPTNIDLNFYTHELKEMELIQQGLGYAEAHERALQHMVSNTSVDTSHGCIHKRLLKQVMRGLIKWQT
ncbi:MAG: hypothetical protein ACX93T_03280 [Bacteroidota bacterium]